MAATKAKSKKTGTPSEVSRDAPAAADGSDETRQLISDLAFKGGKLLLESGVLGRLFGRKGKQEERKRPSLGQGLVQGAILRVATRSVPGAILVGGGLLAKTLHERRKSRKARERAAIDVADGDDGGQEA